MQKNHDKRTFPPLKAASAAMAYVSSRDQGICITCNQNYIVYVNQAFCDVFGYTDFHEMNGINMASLIADKRPHPHHDDMQKYFPLGTGDRKKFLVEGDVKGYKKNGSVFTVRIHKREGFYAGDQLFMSCVALLPPE